jgi:hypothetical protein
VSVNPQNVLIGIDAGERIAQGMFFRLTFAPTFFLFGTTFNANINGAFADLDAAEGLAQPVSDLAVSPGQYAAVFDVLVRQAAIGMNAADLANYFDGLRFGLSLTSMTRVDVAAVQSGATDRDTLQSQLDESVKAKDPLQIFGTYAKYAEWVLILLIVLLVLYAGSRAFKIAKAVI